METFPDLYWDVAEALQAHSHPAEALHYYTIINDHDQVYPLRRLLMTVQWTCRVGSNGSLLCRIK